MNTAAAAAQAHVTVATIRTWCRRGVVTATKTAGRWVIDTASLARRITIGKERRMAKTHTTATGTIVQTRTGRYGIRGDADTLAAAYEAGAPVAPSNAPYADDRIYLGLTRETYGDYGRTLETTALAYIKSDGQAVYYIDTERLDEAPAFRTALQQEQDRMAAEEAAMYARDDDYLNPHYM